MENRGLKTSMHGPNTDRCCIWIVPLVLVKNVFILPVKVNSRIQMVIWNIKSRRGLFSSIPMHIFITYNLLCKYYIGFSYNENDDARCYASSSDDVADGALRALRQFYQLFPEYQRNDFYISTTSYGGLLISFYKEDYYWASQIFRHIP